MKALFLFITLLSLSSLESLNLEDHVQDFILDTKQLHIPGYPDAFNPGVIEWQDKLLISFRVIPDPKQSFTSYIGLVWADRDFNFISEPALLDLRGLSNVPSRAEDGRMINIDGHIYLIYSDDPYPEIKREYFRVYVGEIEYDGKNFSVKEIWGLTDFEGNDPDKREKNWVPFQYENRLYLAYSLEPHRILYHEQNRCYTLFETPTKITWDWGEIRGGTPAVKIDEQNYLSFFHSSKVFPSVHSENKSITHYLMGAYLFNSSPPFQINSISPAPIVGRNFYNGKVPKPYWKPVRVVFPCGILLSSTTIWVTYGRQDRECWVVKIDRKKFLDSLIPVYDSAP